MAVPRLLRPTSRLLSSRFCSGPQLRPAFQPALCASAARQRRSYATSNGVKEVAVRDALNEALAEELAGNDNVFLIGEEIAQYNGA